MMKNSTFGVALLIRRLLAFITLLLSWSALQERIPLNIYHEIIVFNLIILQSYHISYILLFEYINKFTNVELI